MGFLPCIDFLSRFSQASLIIQVAYTLSGSRAFCWCQNAVTGCYDLSQVKQFFNEVKQHTPPKTRKGSSTAQTDSSRVENIIPSHISDKLLGQHGGELLLYYEHSIHQERVIGMIVQETKVSLMYYQVSSKCVHLSSCGCMLPPNVGCIMISICLCSHK